MSDSSIWILCAGVNDDVCGTFSSREKAEKQGSFLQSCGELSTYTVTEYVARTELDAAREAVHYANGVADLAMKHRDTAEARAATLREALKPCAFGVDGETCHRVGVDVAAMCRPCAARAALAEGEDTAKKAIAALAADAQVLGLYGAEDK